MKDYTNTAPSSQLEASAKILERLMEQDERIVVLTADLVGSCKLSAIEKRFPERFINVGIAEQNMVSLAAGLAHEGMKPYVHTFSVFSSLRACEQIRTDVFYNGTNVKIMGTHCGVSTAVAGPTHFSLEDIGVIRSMPQSAVVTPSDAVSAAKIIEMLDQDPRPIYIRLDRNPLPVVYSEEETFAYGKGKLLRQGRELAIISMGSTLAEALAAAELLEEATGLRATVVDMPFTKPMDDALLRQLAQDHRAILTVEEHNIYGGLGNAVAQSICGQDLPLRLRTLGVRDFYPAGNPVKHNRALLGIDRTAILAAAREMGF